MMSKDGTCLWKDGTCVSTDGTCIRVKDGTC